MGLSRFEHRLFTDDSLTINVFCAAECVLDFPMSGSKLHAVLAAVLNSNGVTKGKMHLIVLIKCTLKTRSDRNLNPSGNLLYHNQLIAIPIKSKRTKPIENANA